MNTVALALKDISAISITPFGADGAIDWPAMEANLQFLLRHGMRAIVPCGNTGETASLTLDEQKTVLSFCIPRIRAGGAVPIAGVGGSLPDAIALARHAETSGADAVMVHHPPGPFVSQRGYHDYVRAIAEATGVALVPYLRSPALKPATVLRLLELPRLAGIKFAVNDLPFFGEVATQRPGSDQFTWVCGTAEIWAPLFFALGAEGFTSGLVNLMPELSRRLLAALRRQDGAEVQRLWRQLKPFEDLRARNQSEHNVAVVKEAMHQLGLGGRAVRPPLSALSAAEISEVTQALESLKAASARPEKAEGFEPRRWNLEETLRGHPPRTNFNVIQLDRRYNVRIAEVTGRFPWHRHPNGDEGWLVWKGRLQIDFDHGRKLVLNRGEGTWIPAGIHHSPLCLEEGTQVVVFNVANFQHQYREEAPDVGDFTERSSV